jgi:hypothetical protein
MQGQFTTQMNSMDNTLAGQMMSVGKNVCQGLANGIRTNTSLVTAASRAMAQQVDNACTVTLQIHSPSRLSKLRGYQWILGFANGISENVGVIERATGQAFDTATTSLTKNLGIYSRTLAYGLSTSVLKTVKGTVSTYASGLKAIEKMQKNLEKMEYNIWKNDKNMQSDIEKANKASKKTYDSDIKAMDADYEKAKKLIENRYSQYKTLTKAQKSAKEKELAELEKTYNRSTKLRESAYNAEVKANEKQIKQQYAMELQSQEYYQNLYDIKNKGYNKMKYADMSMEEFAEEFYSNALNIANEYISAIEDKRDSIMSSLDFFTEAVATDYSTLSGIFEEVSADEAKSADTLLTNIQAQIDAQSEYVSVMNSLTSRLDGTALLGYLQTLGVD